MTSTTTRPGAPDRHGTRHGTGPARPGHGRAARLDALARRARADPGRAARLAHAVGPALARPRPSPVEGVPGTWWTDPAGHVHLVAGRGDGLVLTGADEPLDGDRRLHGRPRAGRRSWSRFRRRTRGGRRADRTSSSSSCAARAGARCGSGTHGPPARARLRRRADVRLRPGLGARRPGALVRRAAARDRRRRAAGLVHHVTLVGEIDLVRGGVVHTLRLTAGHAAGRRGAAAHRRGPGHGAVARAARRRRPTGGDTCGSTSTACSTCRSRSATTAPARRPSRATTCRSR